MSLSRGLKDSYSLSNKQMKNISSHGSHFRKHVKKDDTLAFICKPILRGNNHSELHYYCMKKEQNWGQLKIFGFWD